MQGSEPIPPGRAGAAHSLGRAGNGLRKRTYIVLLGALLVMILAVSGLTIKLLQGQRTLLEETLRDARAQTMALLSNRIEQAIFSTLRTPFLALKNIPPQEVEMARYDHVRKTFPEVEQVLFLKPDLSLQNSLPPPASEADRRLNAFLVQRTAMEDLNSRGDRYVLHTFVDTVDGRPTLFALQRVSEMDRASGWILIRFNLDVIKRKRLTPLLNEFSAKLGGEVQLKDPDAPWNDNALNWPVGRVLPGWLLVSRTSSQAAAQHLQRDRTLMMGVTAGVILAMLMAAFAVWRELRREHALVDLRNRFVANVSHELKTPLALIRMYAETLYLRRITDEERRHQYHRILLHEAERLSQMIDTVLDFSRLSQGVDLYQLTATDLRRTVTDVLDSYRWRTGDAGLRLEVQLEEAVPPVAHDRYGITQILRNLIDNAVKYAAAGGVVRVALRSSRQHGIELAVSDHGPGIPAADRERVRQPFQRGRDADPVSGSGLGLALVDQIAKSHHARLLLITPADGNGLEAIVRFPAPAPAS
jgi:signal transduction histidine kinase